MEQIKAFCDRWQVTEFSLFGSVLRDDFRPDSDIDVMVQFHPEAHPTFLSLDNNGKNRTRQCSLAQLRDN